MALQELASGDVAGIKYRMWIESGGKLGDEVDSKTDTHARVTVNGNSHAIKGLEQGLAGMKKGGKRLLVVPPSLAFGKAGGLSSKVPPDTALVIEIDLVRVRSANARDDDNEPPTPSKTDVTSIEDEKANLLSRMSKVGGQPVMLAGAPALAPASMPQQQQPLPQAYGTAAAAAAPGYGAANPYDIPPQQQQQPSPYNVQYPPQQQPGYGAPPPGAAGAATGGPLALYNPAAAREAQQQQQQQQQQQTPPHHHAQPHQPYGPGPEPSPYNSNNSNDRPPYDDRYRRYGDPRHDYPPYDSWHERDRPPPDRDPRDPRGYAPYERRYERYEPPPAPAPIVIPAPTVDMSKLIDATTALHSDIKTTMATTTSKIEDMVRQALANVARSAALPDSSGYLVRRELESVKADFNETEAKLRQQLKEEQAAHRVAQTTLESLREELEDERRGRTRAEASTYSA